jgi:hypothetical protein
LTGLAWALFRVFCRQDRKEVVFFAMVASVFYLVAYLVWFRLFNIERFAIPLELLAGVLAGLTARALGLIGRPRSTGWLLAVLVLVLAATRPVHSGRGPWTAEWIGAHIPAALNIPDTLYVVTGWDAVAWVVLDHEKLGTRADFVRVAGNLSLYPDRGLGMQIRHRIEAHAGPIRSLTNLRDLANAPAELQRFGLQIVPGPCVTITAKADDLQSCLLRRVAVWREYRQKP